MQDGTLILDQIHIFARFYLHLLDMQVKKSQTMLEAVMNTPLIEKRAQVINLQVEGMSLRAISRVPEQIARKRGTYKPR